MGKNAIAALLLSAGFISGAFRTAEAASVLTLEEMDAQDRTGINLLENSGDVLKSAIIKHYRGGYYGPYVEMRRDMKVEDHVFDGCKWYSIATKQDVKSGATKKILYLHGGAWILETSAHQLTFAAYLAEHSGAEVWFPEYPLAPEHSAAEAFEMLSGLYQEMLKGTPAEGIAVMGDSAGGSIALGLGMYLRDNGLPQPNNLILFSPGVDIALWRGQEEIDYNRKLVGAGLNAVSSNAQSTIMAWWRGELPETDYRVNSLYGDLRGLAPLTIFVGSAENESIMKLAAKAAEQRVPLKYWEKMNAVHTWVTMDGQDNQRERDFVIDVLRNPVDFQKGALLKR